MNRRKKKNRRLRKVIRAYREAYPHLIDEREAERLEGKYLAPEKQPGKPSGESPELIEPEALAERIGDRVEEKVDGGVSLGERPGPEEEIDISPGLQQPKELRTRHTYLVGKTGYGKSNLIRHLAFQDMEEGRGVGILTPEADLIRDKILPFIPEDRVEDVIYFNPGDQERPIPFNPFHLEEGEDKNLRADMVYSILEEAMPKLTGATMQALLRHSVHSLVEREGSTLMDLLDLWGPDPTLREEIVATTEDQATRDFWENDYPQFRKDSYLYLKNRLAGFTRPPISTLMGEGESLSFRKAMDRGKILLFQLSPGLLGKKNSGLLGQLIVASLSQATLSRDEIPEAQRRPFYLYIDEFQNFIQRAASSYETLLNRARKYKIGLYLAHQETEDLPSEVFAQVKGASTMAVFNVHGKDARRLSRELFVEEPERLQKLDKGEMVVKLGSSSFLVRTSLVDNQVTPRREKRRKEVVKTSRKNYGVTPTESGEGPRKDQGSGEESFLE